MSISARALTTTLLLLLAAVRPGLAADAQLVSLGVGTSVQGLLNGASRNVGFAGIFNLSIDGGPLTQGYCVDITHSIRVGDTVPQVPPVSPCEAVYILNNFYPHGTAVLTASKEAAAVQSAIWFFTDGYDITGPSDIAARADQIAAAAQGQCSAVPPVPNDITVTPATDTASLPGTTTHGVTATLHDTAGHAIPNYPIRIDITGVAGPQTFQGTSNAAGQYSITYTNTLTVTGTDTITASASFTVPVGQEFKSPDKQGIVVAGAPRTGTVDGTATMNWVAATCGDGRANQSGEECDDGNAVNGDGCDNNCTITRCGNNVVTAGEECDDGNATNGDGCDTNCTVSRCGNGVVDPGETCDDGNAVDGDGCDTNCTPTGCGNGVRTGSEECDDGNVTSGDGCDVGCKLTRCGNGIRTTGEECDDGNTVNGDGCDNNCTVSRCGNGIRENSEECDDGNAVNGDGCDANCTTTRCGNGIVTAGEQCDDGNLLAGDSCSPTCTVLPQCGNHVVDAGEECDDGNTTSGDGCDANCTITRCGNGVMTAGEACDDGNTIDGDGCDSNCTPTRCGNGIKTGSEECDDGNQTDGDGCDSNCTTSRCGNGIVAGTEECDDGNNVAGDGCQPDCTRNTCGNGIVDPGEQCDDGNLVTGDGCSPTCKRQEVCGDLDDEDGNGLYDCDDITCAGVMNRIYREPAKIMQFDRELDRFKTRGGIPVLNPADFDPPTQRVGILVSNAHHVLLRTWLEPGSFPTGPPTTPNRWMYVNRSARETGGVFSFQIARNGTLKSRREIRLKMFGDLSDATEPTMTVELVVGPRLYCTKASWRKLPIGWALSIHEVPIDITDPPPLP